MLQCTPRNVTGLVDALEEYDLVERQPHPTDRRAFLVGLTDQGEEAARAWTSQARQLAARVFTDLETDDIEALITTLDQVLGKLGIPPGAARVP